MPVATTACPACGSNAISKAIGRYQRCGECKLERVDTLSPQSGLMENNRARTKPVGLGPMLRAQLRVAGKHYLDGMDLLDFGCGDGRFLYHASRELAPGRAAYGIEQSEASVQVAREVHGCTVFSDTSDVPEGRYLATAWQVIEHLPPSEAVDILCALRARLAPGSRFIVSVPNHDAHQAALFGSKWVGREADYHYLQFGSESLDRMMRTAGFVPKADSWIALYGFYTSAQSAANVFVKPFNQAHRWLKRGNDAGTALHTAASLAIAAASTPLTLGFAALEAAQPRRRATITRMYEVAEPRSRRRQEV